jgi:hypothetical protein
VDEPLTIYSDGVVEAALMLRDSSVSHIGIRWLEPQPSIGRAGELLATTNIMGGSTDWFLLPHSFGAAVAKALIERHTAGLHGFQAQGVSELIRWLVDMEELPDSMCY